MTWYRADVELLTHVKLSRLRRRLELPPYAALGILHALWSWVKLHRPGGDLTGLDAVDIAELIGWEDDPEALLAALTAEGTDTPGFIDTNPLRVHDWDDYQPDEAARAARSLAAKAGPHKAHHEAKGIYREDCPYCREAHETSHSQSVVGCPWCTNVRSDLLPFAPAKRANALNAQQTHSKRTANAMRFAPENVQTLNDAQQTHNERRASAEHPLNDAQQTQSKRTTNAEQTHNERRASAEHPLNDAQQTQSKRTTMQSKRTAKRTENGANAEQTQSKRTANAEQKRAFATTSTRTSTRQVVGGEGEKTPSRAPALTPDERKQFAKAWDAYPLRKGRRAGKRKDALEAWANLTPAQRIDAARAAAHLTQSGEYPPNMSKFLAPAEDGYGFTPWIAPPAPEGDLAALANAEEYRNEAGYFAPNHSPDDATRDF